MLMEIKTKLIWCLFIYVSRLHLFLLLANFLANYNFRQCPQLFFLPLLYHYKFLFDFNVYIGNNPPACLKFQCKIK